VNVQIQHNGGIVRRIPYLFIVLVFVFIGAGCATNKSRVVEGAGVGGAVGAIAGAIVGHQSGHALEGAAIGGAAGAGGGALVGAQINKPNQDTSTQISMQQVVNWTKQGVSSDEIISKIKTANPKYSLTADDIDYLKRQGVSQRVIETMQAYK